VSTTLEPRTTLGPAPRARPRACVVRRFVGGFYLVMGGINAGIVAADPQTYRPFADDAYWSFVTEAWHDVVMARQHPSRGQSGNAGTDDCDADDCSGFDRIRFDVDEALIKLMV